jgi:peptide-methionine (R)-S-oxide reductase
MKDMWKDRMTPLQYRVMKEKETEEAQSGKYWDFDENGVYTCAACGGILFLSINKFKHENGWPAFTKSANKRIVELIKDGTRVEVVCHRCKSHLGFFEKEDGKEYYQINSVALEFTEFPDVEWLKEEQQKKEEAAKKEADEKAAAKSKKTLMIRVGVLVLAATLGGTAVHVSAAAPTKCISKPTVVQTTGGSPSSSVAPPCQAPSAAAATSSQNSVPQAAAATTSQNAAAAQAGSASAGGTPGTSADPPPPPGAGSAASDPSAASGGTTN